MLFKNVRIYPLTETFELKAHELSEKCEKHEFKECSRAEMFKLGWVRPLGKTGEFVHALNGYLMVALRKDEKIIPGAVVNEILRTRVEEKEDEEGRRLSAKERSEMKDEIISEMLPKAFIKPSHTFAYIDTRNQRIIVDAGSAGKAEELISFLRATIGGLPCVPLTVNADPSVIMTSWLRAKTGPLNFEIGGDCELKDSNGDDGVVTCKKEDLFSSQVINHVNFGKQVTKIELTWDNKVSFMLDKEVGFKRIKFLDGVMSSESQSSESKEERFDADFDIFTETFSDLLDDVLVVFDGQAPV